MKLITTLLSLYTIFIVSPLLAMVRVQPQETVNAQLAVLQPKLFLELRQGATDARFSDCGNGIISSSMLYYVSKAEIKPCEVKKGARDFIFYPSYFVASSQSTPLVPLSDIQSVIWESTSAVYQEITLFCKAARVSSNGKHLILQHVENIEIHPTSTLRIATHALQLKKELSQPCYNCTTCGLYCMIQKENPECYRVTKALSSDWIVRDIGWSPDGKYCVSTNDTNAAVYESHVTYDEGHNLQVAIGELKFRLSNTVPNITIATAQFSPDSQHIVTTNSDNIIRIWNVQTRMQVAEFAGHQSKINSVLFSLDGKYLVSISDDTIAYVWHAQTGKKIASLIGHKDCINWAEFSPDGKYIITASDDKTARIWHTQTGKQVATLTGNESKVCLAKYNPNGQQVLTVNSDKKVAIFDLPIFKL